MKNLILSIAILVGSSAMANDKVGEIPLLGTYNLVSTDQGVCFKRHAFEQVPSEVRSVTISAGYYYNDDPGLRIHTNREGRDFREDGFSQLGYVYNPPSFGGNARFHAAAINKRGDQLRFRDFGFIRALTDAELEADPEEIIARLISEGKTLRTDLAINVNGVGILTVEDAQRNFKCTFQRAE